MITHWRESTFANELMSGFIAAPDNPLSRMTVAGLADLGYQVNAEATEPYAQQARTDTERDGPIVARMSRRVLNPAGFERSGGTSS